MIFLDVFWFHWFCWFRWYMLRKYRSMKIMFTMLWNEHSILLTSKYYTQCTTLYYTESALLTMDSRVKFVRVPEFRSEILFCSVRCPELPSNFFIMRSEIRSENHFENPYRSKNRLNLVPKPDYFIWNLRTGVRLLYRITVRCPLIKWVPKAKRSKSWIFMSAQSWVSQWFIVLLGFEVLHLNFRMLHAYQTILFQLEFSVLTTTIVVIMMTNTMIMHQNQTINHMVVALERGFSPHGP